MNIAVIFGPEWNDTTSLLDLNDFQAPMKAGAKQIDKQVQAEVARKGWESFPEWTEPKVAVKESSVEASIETDSKPFLWVDEGVEGYSFGGPGSGYKMTFQHTKGTKYQSYSPKSDGGTGQQQGPKRKGVEGIANRDIRKRDITQKTMDAHADEIWSAVEAAL